MLSSSRVELLVILVLLVSALLKVATAKAISLGCMDRNSMLPFRGLLAVCVVVHHIPGTIVSLGTVAVGAFFFLSGYGMFQSYSNKRVINGQRVYGWVVRLMLPFFVCVVIWVFSLKCLYYLGIGNGIEISQFPAKLMSGHSGDILPNCWFVWSLLVLKLIWLLILPQPKVVRLFGNFVRRYICILHFCALLSGAMVVAMVFIVVVPRWHLMGDF